MRRHFLYSVRKRTRLFLFSVSILVGVGVSLSAEEAKNCLAEFRNRVVGRSYEEKVEAIRDLQDPDFACLFRSAVEEPPLTIDFFIDREHPEKIRRFFGKNSFLLFNYFERHFFGFERDGILEVYGYTLFPLGKLLQSPGFFYVDPLLNPHRLIFDYTLDFPKRIPQEVWDSLEGKGTKRVKNNHGNWIFGRLHDVVLRVSDDIAVGEAVRIREGEEQHQTYFILLRFSGS